MAVSQLTHSELQPKKETCLTLDTPQALASFTVA